MVSVYKGPLTIVLAIIQAPTVLVHTSRTWDVPRFKARAYKLSVQEEA